MLTRTFWSAAAERAAKTAAQSALLFIGADQFDVLAFDWPGLFGFAAGGAVLSLLSSITVGGLTDGNPSLGDAETLDH